MFESVDVLGVAFAKFNMRETVAYITGRCASGQGTFVVTANPEIVMYAKDHPDYAGLIKRHADLVTADGIGIIKGAQMLGTPLPERVTGYDLLHELLGVANDNSQRVYLLGAKADVNAMAVAKVQEQYPNVRIVGAHDGYFSADAAIMQDIISAKPDFVFAALGFPRQEQFLAGLQPSLPKAVLMGVGGSFDVLAGTAKRAPVWMQNAHLEWFYRLLKQPSRIGRMMVLPKFLVEVRKSKQK
ncbi:WecB/TagA/CpsF family glycosyltransferase [Lacticaseibacillus hulanensis]|uniref:WecB/TagA/CpsF family glycosyltransferase n=1 Tax=Lacticaseibacillus hulanensis TaxID=2493111 RepID=UPI000FD84D80|nr:WecB/TagA/CpsF family glycosyltransferase [Lacticaseibacillus hulanensis]